MKVAHRIEQQQEYLIGVQDDARRDDFQYRNNGAPGRRRQSSASMVCHEVKREKSCHSDCDNVHGKPIKPRRRSVDNLRELDKDKLPDGENVSRKSKDGLMSKVRRSGLGKVVDRHVRAAQSTASSIVGIPFLFHFS